jgi:hypothetical protein
MTTMNVLKTVAIRTMDAVMIVLFATIMIYVPKIAAALKLDADLMI